MKSFVGFMASSAGRILRIVAGIALIGWGVSMSSATGTVVALIGLVPLPRACSTSACSPPCSRAR
jgi:hypothetical protein